MFNFRLKSKIKTSWHNINNSTIIKNFFVYSFGSFLLRGISLIFTPITMSILAPHDYGLIALANSFVSILCVFTGLGLRQAFSIEYFHCNNVERKTMINHMIILYLIISTPFLLIFYFYPKCINTFIFANNAPKKLVSLSLIYVFLYFFIELFYQALAYQQQAIQRTSIQIISALMVIACNLFLLCWLKWGVLSLMAGQIVGLIIVFVMASKSYFQKKCHQYIPKTYSIKKSFGYLQLGLPFIPGMLCGWILASSDRWVLAHYTTMSDVGIYSLAATFGALFQLLILLPMSQAYIPAVIKKFSENKHNPLMIEQWNKKIMWLSMTTLTVLVSVGYILCKPLLYLILPLKYQAAINYIWMILLGYIFLLGEHFASILLIYTKRIYFQSISLVLPTLLNFGLNLILVPYLGITGCVIGTLVAYIAYFVIKLWYNIRIQKLFLN